MTGYRIPWRKIENQSDLPALYSWVITSDDEGCVRADHRDREGYWVYSFGKVIAWAPLPAPYDPDEAEPVDEIAALRARCERLVRELRAFGPISTQIGLFIKEMVEASKGLKEAHDALLPSDLEVSE